MDGYGYLTITPMLVHLPFAMLAVMQPAMVAVGLTLMPSICSTIYPGQALDRCVGWGAAKVASRGVVLPMLVVYLAELRARRVFLGSPAVGDIRGWAGAREAAPWHRPCTRLLRALLQLGRRS